MDGSSLSVIIDIYDEFLTRLFVGQVRLCITIDDTYCKNNNKVSEFQLNEYRSINY